MSRSTPARAELDEVAALAAPEPLGEPDEPECPGRQRRRLRIGLVALLPALLMAAVYVASPFAGTQTVDQPGTSPTQTYPPVR